MRYLLLFLLLFFTLPYPFTWLFHHFWIWAGADWDHSGGAAISFTVAGVVSFFAAASAHDQRLLGGRKQPNW